MTPPLSAPPIVWAVFLGANTSSRLAREWGISYHAARRALHKAFKRGWIHLMISGWSYRTPTVYGVTLISENMRAA